MIEKTRSGTAQDTARSQIFTSAGLCCFSQSLSAASIRVCQPLPVSLKASITSGEYRMVADFFVGAVETGLPRRMVLWPSLRLALSKKESSSSGASSGSTQVLFKSFNFAFISLPHRDNAARLIALRPDHNNKPGIQFAYGNLPDFTVVLPVVLSSEVNTGKNLCGSGEINAAFKQRFLSLAMVVFNFHTIIVVTLNNKSNVDYLNFGSYITSAAAKSVAGIETPEFTRAHNRAIAVFLCAMHGHIQIMVGRAGQPSGWPGSLVTGSLNPVRLTTHEIETSGGESSELTREAAIMATILILTPPRFSYYFRGIPHYRTDAVPELYCVRADTLREAESQLPPLNEVELVDFFANSTPREIELKGEL